MSWGEEGITLGVGDVDIAISEGISGNSCIHSGQDVGQGRRVCVCGWGGGTKVGLWLVLVQKGNLMGIN